MNTKNLVLMALLVAIGATLYLIVPPITGTMKIDFMLAMMFVGMLLFRDVKSVFLLALSTGVISGLFSTFPLGFFPNIIDKLVTAFIIFALIKVLKNIANNLFVATALTGLGTLISGTIFLSVALFILGVELPGLENPFPILFVTVVLPTIVINSLAFFIIYPVVNKLMKRSSFNTAIAN
ncbi:tryptophan transporter [Sporosarcina sp. CAU 1771]